MTPLALTLAALALLAVLERIVPLRPLRATARRPLAPNLVLGALTLALNIAAGVALAALLALGERGGLGLLARVEAPAFAKGLLAVLVLDLSFYVSHRAMHRLPELWRFHRVHHSDPAVDVTTTLRQHPAETLIRYVFLTAFALPLGASPEAFALYRLASVLSGLLEHANLRLPASLDAALSLVFTWPGYHKIHHARELPFTDTNYGNLVSWWDRIFSTSTPARVGRQVAYGLEGCDDPAQHTTAALLALPLRRDPSPGVAA